MTDGAVWYLVDCIRIVLLTETRIVLLTEYRIVLLTEYRIFYCLTEGVQAAAAGGLQSQTPSERKQL